MKVRIIAIGLIAGVVALAVITHKGAVASPAVQQDRTDLVQVGAPLAAAHLTASQALNVARGSEWGPMLAKGTGLSVQFGSWHNPLVTKGSMGTHIEANIVQDVWAVTVRGLSIPTHGPIGQTAGELRRYMSVFVDDASGAIVETVEY